MRYTLKFNINIYCFTYSTKCFPSFKFLVSDVVIIKRCSFTNCQNCVSLGWLLIGWPPSLIFLRSHWYILSVHVATWMFYDHNSNYMLEPYAKIRWTFMVWAFVSYYINSGRFLTKVSTFWNIVQLLNYSI